MTKTCESCKWWYNKRQAAMGKEQWGNCRRYPPTQNTIGLLVEGTEYYCGEWEYKELSTLTLSLIEEDHI